MAAAILSDRQVHALSERAAVGYQLAKDRLTTPEGLGKTTVDIAALVLTHKLGQLGNVPRGAAPAESLAGPANRIFLTGNPLLDEAINAAARNRPFVEGVVETPRTAAHRFLQQTIAEEMLATGDYYRVGMGRPLSEFSGLEHIPDIRPDNIGLTHGGQIDMLEIRSPGQTMRRLERKLLEASEQLPPEIRGGIRVINPKDALK